MIAIAALGILGSCQSGIILDSGGNRVQDISDFLFQFISINQRLIGGRFGIAAQSTSILKRPTLLVLLKGQTKISLSNLQPVMGSSLASRCT